MLFQAVLALLFTYIYYRTSPTKPDAGADHRSKKGFIPDSIFQMNPVLIRSYQFDQTSIACIRQTKIM